MNWLGSPQKGMNASRYLKIALVLALLIAAPWIWRENRFITTIFISAIASVSYQAGNFQVHAIQPFLRMLPPRPHQ